MTLLLGAFADDLTGTTDFANTLVRQGMRAVRLIGIPRPEPHAMRSSSHSKAAPASRTPLTSKSFRAPLRQEINRSPHDPPSDMF